MERQVHGAPDSWRSSLLVTLLPGDERLQLHRLSEPATEDNLPPDTPGQSREEVCKHREEICTHSKPCMQLHSLALVHNLGLPGLQARSHGTQRLIHAGQWYSLCYPQDNCGSAGELPTSGQRQLQIGKFVSATFKKLIVYTIFALQDDSVVLPRVLQPFIAPQYWHIKPF